MRDLSNDNIVHIKTDNVEFIQFKELLKYEELTHAYTLSVNNFDVAGNATMEEKYKQVVENYKLISNELGIDYNKIIRPYQTHTDNIECVNNEVKNINIFPKEYWNVDGLLTNKKDIILSLGYADCIPLFFYDPIKKVIGNIHSGWKGTVQKIGQKAVYKMIELYGCKASDIICCIGPSIRKCHFEVKKDVYSLFYNTFLYTNKINDIIDTDKNNNEKYYIDTVLINKIILEEAGLKKENIIDSNICTACNSSVMHSYRIAGDLAGRNTAIIALKK